MQGGGRNGPVSIHCLIVSLVKLRSMSVYEEIIGEESGEEGDSSNHLRTILSLSLY